MICFKPFSGLCIHVSSPLYQAVQCQHERCVSILLENHAEPNLVDVNGNTALHLAANIPSITTAVLLLEHEANINAQNKVSLSFFRTTIQFVSLRPNIKFIIMILDI